jgi:hypothetical protein
VPAVAVVVATLLSSLFLHPGAIPNPVPGNDPVRFDLSIPGETASPTTSIEVVIDSGTPPRLIPRSATGHGWRTEVTATGFSFTGGALPSGGRIDFEVTLDHVRGAPPATAITLKVFETAADGTVLAYVDPAGPLPALLVDVAAPAKGGFPKVLILAGAALATLAVGFLARRLLTGHNRRGRRGGAP